MLLTAFLAFAMESSPFFAIHGVQLQKDIDFDVCFSVT
jgi:hypothetical protein